MNEHYRQKPEELCQELGTCPEGLSSETATETENVEAETAESETVATETTETVEAK